MEEKKKWFNIKDRMSVSIFSLVGITWVVAFILVGFSRVEKSPDLSTLLFGVSSVAIFVLSFFVAVLAIFGWQTIQENIRDKVEAVTNERIEHLKNEMRGRVFSGLGYMVGEMSLNPHTLTSVDPVRLSSAIELCEQGYALLKKVQGPVEYMGLNNLVFYSFLSDDELEKAALLGYARDLLAKGKEHGAVNLQLTACRVILDRSDDEKEKNEAIRLLVAIEQSGKVSMRARQEARIYLDAEEKKGK